MCIPDAKEYVQSGQNVPLVLAVISGKLRMEPSLEAQTHTRLRTTLVVLGAVALLLGGTKAWLELARPALDVWRARDWESAPVRAVEVRVMPFHGIVHTDTEYTYRVAGVDHVGERYAFVDPSRFLTEDEILELQSFEPETCWVDPSDASRAVLVRTLPLDAYRWSGLLVIALGLALLVLAVLSRTSARAARVVIRMPTIWSRTSVMLAAASFAFLALVRVATPAMFVALALAWLGVRVWRRSPGALIVLAVLGAVAALVVVACAANPFALMDEAVDRANEPAFLMGYATDALSIAMLGCATTLLALAARDQANR
jgi:hypothetical protein